MLRAFVVMACLAVAAAGLFSLSGLMVGASSEPAKRIIFIGLDGLEWNITGLLLEEGKMPNLARLIENGVHGKLRTLTPTYSPIIWTTQATGKGPDKHGIMGFTVDVRRRGGASMLFSSDMRETKAIWNILSEHNISVGVVNWFVSWPAEPVNGFMVSDYKVMGQIKKAWPPELDQRLLNKQSSEDGMHLLDGLELTRPTDFLSADEIANLTEEEKASLERPLEPEIVKREYGMDDDVRKMGQEFYEEYRPDVLMVYFEGTDTIQHSLWRSLPPETFNQNPDVVERYEEIVRRYYEYADRILGDFLEYADNDTVVIVTSDHGFETHDSVGRTFNVNRLLRRMGLAYSTGEEIDWNRTRVSDCSVYSTENFDPWLCINVKSGSIGAVEADMKDIEEVRVRKMLMALETVDGLPLFDSVEFGDRDHDLAGHINMDAVGRDIEIGGEVLNGSMFLDMSSEYRAHDKGPPGTIVMSGKDIRSGGEITGATVYDITPTILHLLGLPVGRDMDGVPLLNALDPAYSRPVGFIDSYDTGFEQRGSVNYTLSDEELERLRALGYIQ